MSDTEVQQHQIPVRVVMQADVLAGEAAGMKVVFLQFTVRNLATEEDEYLVLTIDSAAAKQVRDRINTVASTVAPLDKQFKTLKHLSVVVDNTQEDNSK